MVSPCTTCWMPTDGWSIESVRNWCYLAVCKRQGADCQGQKAFGPLGSVVGSSHSVGALCLHRLSDACIAAMLQLHGLCLHAQQCAFVSMHSSVAGCLSACLLTRLLSHPPTPPLTHRPIHLLTCSAEPDKQLEAQQGDARQTSAATDVHTVPETVCVLR